MNARQAWAVLWRMLTPAQRRRALLLQIAAVFMALSTVAGLAAVMTFLAVLTDPTFVQTHAPLAWLSRNFGSGREFVLALGGGFIALLVLSAALNLSGMRAMGRFAHSAGDRIRELLFADYLRREYLFHARTGSAQLLDDVLYQADRLTHTLVSLQLLITNAVLTLLVVASIAIASPWVALFGVLAVAGCYGLFYRLLRWRLSRHGATVSRMGAERTAVAEQAFLGIKYLLIARAQRTFDQRFHAATRALSHSLAEANLIGQSPRYLLECVAGATLIACAAFAGGGATGSAWLAQLSFIAFAGFRLLPAAQQMYQASVVVRANRAVIENLAAQLERSAASSASPPPESLARPAPLRSIELIDVGFRYSPDLPWVLDGASLRIEAGSAIGIIGASGCGKTTVVDLLSGLMMPARGRIDIDGQPLDAQRVAAWQRNIGYVPQDVLILDASVRENIAFGVDPADIDDERVRAAALQAGASSFIEALPGGYLARTAGLGGSLSGGQRQRLGLARALYRDPALLVLDEATNALDAETERSIIDTVVRNRGTRTVVVVAHGAAAIAACERVYELSGGRLHERRASGERSSRLRWGVE